MKTLASLYITLDSILGRSPHMEIQKPSRPKINSYMLHLWGVGTMCDMDLASGRKDCVARTNVGGKLLTRVLHCYVKYTAIFLKTKKSRMDTVGVNLL